MLSFLKKPRKGSINTGAGAKYILYALGEIILVVVGILIALRVNNTNEDRKLRVLEKEILQELVSNFERDVSDLNVNTNLTDITQNSRTVILSHIQTQLPYHDSLDIHFGRSFWFTNFMASTSAYEVLKSKGLDIIRNKKIRTKIQQTYEFTYQNIIKTAEWALGIQSSYNDECKNHFTIWNAINFDQNKQAKEFADEMVPNNYVKLKNSSSYIYELSNLTQANRFLGIQYKNSIEDVTQLINDINSEIAEM